MSTPADAQGKGATRSDENDSYDPYAHREVTKTVSDFGSLANLVKSAAGTGLFAMPNAFACVGLVNGVIGTILMGILITVSLQILLKIHHTMCIRLRKPMLLYDEVVIASLTTGNRKSWVSPEISTFIVDVTILTCYLGIGAVYIVFISGIIQECIDAEKTVSQSYYALILFPFLLLMNMARNLHDIAPISIIGNITLFSAGLIGIVYALKDGIGDTWFYIGPNISHYPKFIGLVFFSMCSPAVILAIENSMEKPWNYVKLCGVLNWGMTFLVLLHALVGAIGYLKWGSESLGNFIRNHEKHDAATMTALVMQASAIYFTYGLQCYMPITILNEEFVMPGLEENICKGTPFFWDFVVRFTVTFVTCILAVAIPKLDLFTGLVGSVCIATLATQIPVTLYILINYGNYGKYKWRLLIGLLLLFVAFFATTCAMVVNMLLIVEFLKFGI